MQIVLWEAQPLQPLKVLRWEVVVMRQYSADMVLLFYLQEPAEVQQIPILKFLYPCIKNGSNILKSVNINDTFSYLFSSRYKILHGRPVYMYDWPAASLKVEDHINPNEKGTGWLRTINVIGSSAQKSNVEVVVGNSPDVVEINAGLLALQGMGYYVQWAGAPAVILNTQAPGKQVRVPLQGNSFTYQLIW